MELRLLFYCPLSTRIK